MKYNLFLSIVCITFSFKCFAQVSIDSLLVHSTMQWNDFPIESLYLQTSKDIYETGEDLWFKAYQLDAQSFGLSDKSKTLYLQMISPKDSVVWQEKYPIENGIACGHVYIDEKLPEGDYLLQGYTRYSFFRNDTTGINFARKVKIVKNIAQKPAPEASKDSAFRFEMFPEGGDLVADIPAKLAFKATDGRGIPVFIEGTLYQDNKPLSKLKSVHDGMGSVLFTPQSDKTYTIELSNGNNYSLPKIHSEGMVLRLAKQDKELLSFIVSQSGSLPKQQIYLVGQIRGMVCCMAKGVLKENLKISIPTDNFLYQGIAEFTLFDASMQPIAERLVYLHPDKKLNITLTSEKDNFAIREKGTVKVKVTDADGNPVRANLGISIYDKAYHESSNPTNILTHCYLSSQIRGNIFNPIYYFDERNKGRDEGMELLLLTQGWRRYIWNVASPVCKGQPFLTDEINGVQTIQSKKKVERNQGTKQLIQASGAAGNSLFTWADSTGYFTVSTDMMKELRGGYVYLKPMLSKEFKPELSITDYFPLIDTVRRNRSSYYPLLDLSQMIKMQAPDMPIVSNDNTILLDEVVITRKARRLFRDKMMGRLDSLAQIELNNAYVCTTCNYLINYRTDYSAHHNEFGRCPARGRKQPINGEKYGIAKFKYYKDNYFTVEDQQTIVYQGPLFTEEELLRMNNLWRTKGYYASREFYHPDEIDIQTSVPDARNTLLWAPTVVTNEKGEASVSFYCSDINTGFIGIVEGVDGVGLLGNANCEFRVLRK